MGVWNGQDLEKETPGLGFTLASAQLIPAFVRQVLDSGLFTELDSTALTPLDDIKQWMRDDPWRTGDHFGAVSELLMDDEKKARKAAEKSGVPFDPVMYELDQMDADPTYETFNPEWAAKIIELCIDDADALNAWCLKAHGLNFALGVSVQLPDPKLNTTLGKEAIARELEARGAKQAALDIATGRRPKLELSGAIQLDLAPKAGGKAPEFTRRNGVGFVRIPVTDPRAGDETVAFLSLAYPLESEGYFLMTFDALRKHLTLKDGEDA